VFLENLALGKPTSNRTTAGNEARLAVDGMWSTFYQSFPIGTQWLIIDLETFHLISEIVVFWHQNQTGL